MRTRAISFRGSKEDVGALRVLAARHGVSMAVLVRRAIDAQYGEDMVAILASFFTQRGTKISQTQDESAI